MARILLLALLASCADDVTPRAALLPIAGEVIVTHGRIDKSTCAAGRDAAAVASELAAALPAAGWRDVVVERHPRIAARWLVRGTREGSLAVAGRIDDSAEASCAGARVSLSVLEVPPGTDRRTAGPSGLSRTSRLPETPLTR